jgi:hypothetical protein
MSEPLDYSNMNALIAVGGPKTSPLVALRPEPLDYSNLNALITESRQHWPVAVETRAP